MIYFSGGKNRGFVPEAFIAASAMGRLGPTNGKV